MVRVGMILVLLAVPVLSGGCGHWQYDLFPAPSWNPKGLATPRITGRERVYVSPRAENLRVRRAGLPIFHTHRAAADLALALTKIFYREFLAQRSFGDLVLIPEPFTSLKEALPLGRKYQVEVLVLGEVPYYLDGGTIGTSALQVDLTVVEVEGGRLLWSSSESLKATPRPIIDLIIVETRPYPTPTMVELTSRLAQRLAKLLHEGQPMEPASGGGGFFKGG